MLEPLQAETVTIWGHGADPIPAYLARPLGAGPYPGVVVIHHMPGWDEGTREIVRRFAAHGYIAICPNLHHRDAPGAAPDDASAAARANGGVPDERFLGDCEGALRYLRAMPSCSGRVATIGYCSGGRQSFLAACELDPDAAVVCYGAFIADKPPAGSTTNVGPRHRPRHRHRLPSARPLRGRGHTPISRRGGRDRRRVDTPRQAPRVPRVRERGTRVLRDRSPCLSTRCRRRRLATNLGVFCGHPSLGGRRPFVGGGLTCARTRRSGSRCAAAARRRAGGSPWSAPASTSIIPTRRRSTTRSTSTCSSRATPGHDTSHWNFHSSPPASLSTPCRGRWRRASEPEAYGSSGGSNSETRACTRRSISSRIRRTTSIGLPAGSSRSQSRYRLPG